MNASLLAVQDSDEVCLSLRSSESRPKRAWCTLTVYTKTHLIVQESVLGTATLPSDVRPPLSYRR